MTEEVGPAELGGRRFACRWLRGRHWVRRERLREAAEFLEWRLEDAVPLLCFEFRFPSRLDNMSKFLTEKVLADHDHHQANGDDIPHDHLHEQQCLLEPRQLGEVVGCESGDGHGGDAKKEAVDVVYAVFGIAGVEDAGHYERCLRAWRRSVDVRCGGRNSR